MRHSEHAEGRDSSRAEAQRHAAGEAVLDRNRQRCEPGDDGGRGSGVVPGVHRPVSEFRVAILTPSTGICRVEYAQSLAHLVGYFAQVRVYPECEHQYLVTDSIIGSGIGANYETMVQKWLDDERGWTHFI